MGKEGPCSALKAQTAACFVTVSTVQSAVKIQRDDRVTTGIGCAYLSVCVFAVCVCASVCALGFISTPRRSFGNYAQGFTHGGFGVE